MNFATRGAATAKIAVIGMACRFPGGVEDAGSYWNLLLEGRTGIVDIPADRWNPEIFYSPEPDTRGKMRTRQGGFLSSDVFGFDPAFFDMSPREVTSMDPQQRLLLQVAFEAVQDAGLRVRDLQAARTGVFVGMSTSDFMQRQQDGSRTDIFAGTGTAFSIAANRVSHRFDLKGPSMTVDTACSSALVAVDQAVNRILSGDCDMALAGGVNCMLDPRPFIAFSTANMLSPTGAIYTFDSRANGFVRGEGCGLVLLKPLDSALRDGDRIYGVIAQTAINQDGHTKTLTSPSGDAQEAMLRDLVARSGISARDVGYVEAHGTGTPVGDPIEATAIGRVFGDERDSPVWVGSFKPNLGHLESASGIAGFMKAVLAVHHGVVPPNRNFENPNPAIAFDALGIRVPTAAEAFGTDPARPRMAVVNSFGFGGTNASALIEQAPSAMPIAPRPKSVPRSAAAGAAPLVVPLSSGAKTGLQLWAGRLAREIEEGSLADESAAAISAALWRRDHLAERAALVVPAETHALTTALKVLADGGEAPGGTAIITGRSGDRPRLALAFSGQGGQWWAMSRRLLQEEPLFRRTVERVGEALKPRVGWSLVEEMLRDEATSLINEADRTQGSIFACQVGLYEMWKARGIEPELLIGHSFGEIAATYVAGVIDLDTVARIIAARGRIPHGSSRRGAMAALGLTVEQLLPLMPEDGSAVIAAYNGPVAQTVSGMEASVEQLIRVVGEQYPDALARRMTMNFGWHSEHLDDCEEAFRNEVGSVSWKSPALPIVSTVTGALQTRFDLDYWWDNLRQPVSYTKAIGFCLDYGIDSFLEIGPHRTLTPLIRGIAQELDRNVSAVNSLDRKEDDYATLARAEAQLFIRGVTLSPPPAPEGETSVWQKLPRMPWASQHLSAIPPGSERFLFEAPRHVLLGRRDHGPEPRWTNELQLANFKYIADHRVNGDTLFPAVGYLEVMGAALRDLHGPGPVELRDFRIHEALSLAADDFVEMRTELDPRTGRLRIFTEHRGAPEGWRLRAEAYGWRHDYDLAAQPAMAAPASGGASIAPTAFYGIARRFGLEYGPLFRPVDGVWRDGASHMRARLRRSADAPQDGYFAFPGMFDGILQACVLFALPPGQEETPDDASAGLEKLVLPVGARRILLAQPLTPVLWVDAKHVTQNNEERFDFEAFDEQGRPLLVIEGLETRALGSVAQKNSGPGEVYLERYEIAASPTGPARRRWLLVNDDDATSATLADSLRACGAEVQRAELAPLRSFDSEGLTPALAAFCAAAPEPAGILFCWDGGSHALAADDAGEALLAATQSITEALVTVARALAGLPQGVVRPKLAVLSRAARQLPGDAPMTIAGVAQSAVIGIARTVANEITELRVQQFDADATSLASGPVLAGLIMADSAEPEYALRNGEIFVARLEKASLATLEPARKTLSLADPAANFRVTMSGPGIIDNIRLRETLRPEPGADEVVVEVAAVGLNFRDVMAASGILPDELAGEAAYWNNLGLEFSGTVVAVGPNVTGWKSGDRVMGMGKGFLRRYARVTASTLMGVPDHVDLAAAASMPVAYLTAHYSLVHVGRVEAGEKVLVQLASGGVGLAAIEVCRHAGAEVLGTAGSEEKRSFLRGTGIAHVMNSRALDFAREVRLATGGRGVDVVLNALSGAGIDKSLECLAPFGRMVEIGKRDLADDKPIGLKSLYWNNSYSVVDLSTLPHEKPQLFLRLLREVEALIAAGAYTPIRSTLFSVTEAAEALRTLARARHIGKVVVSFDRREVEVEEDLARPISFRADGSYLVTGGLKGFGARIGDWLSARGAGKVILANRAGKPDAATAALISAMEARGTIVERAALDVSDEAAVAGFVEARCAGDMPLRGIFHAAAVIEDAFLTQLDRDKIRRVLGPKVAGAQALDAAVRRAGVKLDHFVLFSSIAQLIGSAGQANYTAANAVLNAFACYRTGRGEAATAVAWGMIGGSGFVARSDAVGNYLESMGIRAVADADAAEALGFLMRGASPYAAFAKVDWPAVMRAFPSVAGNARLKPVLELAQSGQSRIQAELMELPRADWEGVLDQLIRGEVARVLKADTATIAVDKKLTELGLDSLSSFELKNRIEAQVEVSIPVVRFLQAPTIGGLSRLVAAAFESKIKAGEAARGLAADGARAGHDAGNAFRPLTRQTVALALAARPMTSPVAAGHLLMSAAAEVSLSAAEIAERLARLGVLHDGLRLAALAGRDGAVGIVIGEAPALHDAEGVITVPGPLWRFEAQPVAPGRTRLTVRAHRAAADAASVLGVLRQWTGEEPIPAEAPSFWAAAAVLEQPEDAAQRINDLAFWKEVLSRAPRHADIANRQRALAPVGFGINRGDVSLLRARLAGAGALDEAAVLAAYAAALCDRFGLGGVVIERHLRPAGEDIAGLVGPVATSHPVVLRAGAETRRVGERLRAAESHAAVDTSLLETLLADDLNRAHVSLRQFGFLLAEPATVDLQPLAANELLFLAVREGGDLLLTLAADTDVLSEEDARSIAEDVARRLATGTALAIEGTERDGRARRSDAAGRTISAQVVGQSGRKDHDIPLTANQEAVLGAIARDGAASDFNRFFTLGSAFHLSPQVDVNRLSAVIRDLRRRHEALRTRFVHDDAGRLAALIGSAPGTGVLDLEEFDDIVRAEERARALVATGLDPFRGELLKFHLLRVGRDRDIVVVRGHHAVLDAYSMGLIVEEMMQLYLGMSLPEVEISTEDFIRTIELSQDREAIARREAHLARVFADPLPRLPDIYEQGYAQGAAQEVLASGVIDVVPEAAQLDELQQRLRQSGVTLSTVLAAALGQSLGNLGRADDVIVMMPVSRRYDRRLRNYVNWVADNCFVRVPTRAPLNAAARSIGLALDENPMLAPSSSIRWVGRPHEALLRRGAYVDNFNSSMLSGYRGQVGTQSSQLIVSRSDAEIDLGLFKVAPVSGTEVAALALHDVELRSYDAPGGTGFRFSFKTGAVSAARARDILDDVFDRMGLGSSRMAASQGLAESGL